MGIMHPEVKPTATLLTGQVGYVACGMQSTNEARVGDTLYHVRSTIEPLPGILSHFHFSTVFMIMQNLILMIRYPSKSVNAFVFII